LSYLQTLPPPPPPTLFPYTTLFRSVQSLLGNRKRALSTDHSRIGWSIAGLDVTNDTRPLGVDGGIKRSLQNMGALADMLAARKIDRKSTRLNSSHVAISYAVFCLKK